MTRAALGGFGAGAVVAVLAVLAEHSNIAFGSYSLSGNGALIVPAVLAPYALFWCWAWTLARGGRALEMALAVVGLHFGLGLVAVLDFVLYPQQPDLSVLDALPGLLFTGAIFVLPMAILAAATYWLFAGRFGLNVLGVVVALVAATFLGAFGFGLGILTGLAVVLVRRAPERTAAIGAALVPLVLLVGNLPYLPALFAPRPL